LRVSTFLWRAVVPNILPALGCAAVLLGLRSVVGQSLPWLVLQGALGAATYLVLYFTTGATPGERQRGLAFITRPLPTRWRPHTVVATSLMTHDETV
jgi:hypothetical protein